MTAFGPKFRESLIATGFAPLLVLRGDGEIIGREDLTEDQDTILRTLLEGYDPTDDPENAISLSNLTDRQFFQGLAEREIITWDEAEAAVQTGVVPQALEQLIEAVIEDPLDRRRALFLIKGAVTFEPSNPLVPMLSARFQWTPEQLNEFWRFCATL